MQLVMHYTCFKQEMHLNFVVFNSNATHLALPWTWTSCKGQLLLPCMIFAS